MMASETIAVLNVVLITGMSGSGKSVALNALEDAGYYCVDNLPPELLIRFLLLEQEHRARHVAIAMDVRSAPSLPLVPQILRQLRQLQKPLSTESQDLLATDSTKDIPRVRVQSLFLDSSTETLVRRFSETRRLHPLSHIENSDQHRTLVDAIELERELLGDLREEAHVLDTSMIRPAQLKSYVKQLLPLFSDVAKPLTLVFQSFAFKRGIPLDADFVFDVRMLPNPHYESQLRDLTGLDAPVIAYLQANDEVAAMLVDIENFLSRWLSALVRDHRSYVTVGIGCTGGQHRSVYIVENLAKVFMDSQYSSILKRHRELDR